jgi:hypothetical protein
MQDLDSAMLQRTFTLKRPDATHSRFQFCGEHRGILLTGRKDHFKFPHPRTARCDFGLLLPVQLFVSC